MKSAGFGLLMVVGSAGMARGRTGSVARSPPQFKGHMWPNCRSTGRCRAPPSTAESRNGLLQAIVTNTLRTSDLAARSRDGRAPENPLGYAAVFLLPSPHPHASLQAMSALAKLHRELERCRRCAKMTGPVIHGPALDTRVMLVGQ